MSGWHTVEEISETFAGGTPSTFEKSYWNGNIVWLQSGRCQNNVIKRKNSEICITARGLAESAAKLIKPNSVLVAITGATCGNIAFLLATVDMASCDLKNDGIPVNLQTIKHLIETNKEWKAKLDKPIFRHTS